MIKLEMKGLNSAQNLLQDAMKDINLETEEMLAVMLQSISANTMPFVPVDTVALINSEYRRTGMEPSGPWAVIGYGGNARNPRSGTPVQEYAVYVHEGPQKNWQKAGASNQFLLRGVQNFIADDLSSIIAAYQS
jgi:hypothetical protein